MFEKYQKHILLSFYFMLGFNFQFPSVAMRFWLIETVKLSPSQLMAIGGICGIPWCLKPLYGFISDSCPIFGYRRIPYIILGCWLNTVTTWALPWYSHDMEVVVLLSFLSSLGACVSDVVCDSIIVVHARNEDEANRGDIQSWCWGLRALGGLIASISGGYAYNALGPELVQVVSGMFPLIVSILFLAIKEDPILEKKPASTTFKKLIFSFKSPSIWKPALFLFIISVTPGFGAVTSYYFENVLKFSAVQFSVLDVTSYVTSIVGTVIYRKYLTKVSFHKIFFVTLCVAWVLKWTYISIVTGFNESLGISNMVLAIADSIILSLLGQFLLLPSVVLAAKICPDGVEGSLYATMMSISNFAGVLSSEWGSVLANVYGVNKNNFGNFWKLIVLCNLIDLIPIASVALVKNKNESPINNTISPEKDGELLLSDGGTTDGAL